MYTKVKDLEALLVLNKINYKKEITIKELNNKRFDYYLPKYKLFIEFDGAQHHYPVKHFDGIDGYIQRMNDDAEKTMWCKNNGFKFIRLNHLMSIDMMWEILQYMMKIKLYINESNVTLPYINEWCELNLNQRNLYIKELFDDYNIYLTSIMGNRFKINDIEPFEIYIINYIKNIDYIGIIKKKNKYTKYYINLDFKEQEKEIKLIRKNVIELFIDELENQNILNNSHLPSKYMYDYYKQWLYDNNLGSKPMKAMEFGTRFSKKIKEYGYTKVEKKRLNQITNDQFNPNNLNIVIDKKKLSNIYINENKI